uniref:Ubiquitin-like domain-containing protein n=1 Tax=Romanomermis culicivorax TaxID=13658 RepID=A0A915KPW4_ROMCU
MKHSYGDYNIYSKRRDGTGARLPGSAMPKTAIFQLLFVRTSHIMPLHVENITGRRVMYNIVLENTVEKLKELIFITENLPVHRQVLIFGQRTLEDNMKLSSYGVSDDSTIKLLILPRSGPINEKAPAYSVEDLTRILVTCLLKKTDKTRLVSSTGDVNGMNENNDFDENLASTSTFIPPSSDLASNLRTMQRLKDLRCSMERLDQMRAKKKQFYEQDIIQGQMRAENAVGYCKSR